MLVVMDAPAVLSDGAQLFLVPACVVKENCRFLKTFF